MTYAIYIIFHNRIEKQFCFVSSMHLKKKHFLNTNLNRVMSEKEWEKPRVWPTFKCSATLYLINHFFSSFLN